MLRETLESAYTRTVAAVKDSVVDYGSKVAESGGLAQAIYLLVIVALMAGFIDALVNPLPNQTYIPYPSFTGETVPEAFVDALVMGLGAAGIYLAIISCRQTTNQKNVNLYLAVALVLLVVSLFTGINMALLKGLG
ncbi:MAG: hypothetical protein JRN58_10465 [Nitrososphaerota archaeon]|jgi:hypothetical protein|nr:hypothetical protein [Nitrososphaerota archaeon]MDG6979489.1 hypothetical protein [Nitrososphaerota archaeon]MDG7009171.1 hypothetical protein [Nitrososphaerota archaeon]MDG7019940.1 hypothetical protein [Nitrososphaerota archaeon]